MRCLSELCPELSALISESKQQVQNKSKSAEPHNALSIPFVEFVALGALMMALTALSIDIMLPALPQIAEEFQLASANDRQFVVFGYLIGLGPGQLVFGPMSDRFGRRPVLLLGLSIYIIASGIAVIASSFEMLLAARALQGFGASAPRTIMVASVRDLFIGHQMARVMSLIMMVFLMVPVLAPAIGQVLIVFGGWKAPFYGLFLAGVLAFFWAGRRLPETRAISANDAPRIGIRAAFIRVLTTRQTVTYMLGGGFMFGCLTSFISSAQQIFVDIYNLGSFFPLAFAGTAVAMMIASFTNSRIVVRYGTRRVSHTAIVCFLLVAAVFFIIAMMPGAISVWGAWAFLSIQLFLFGLITPNFNAIAMEPQGKIAGMAASIIGFYTTLAGAFFGWLIGGAFDGTLLPISFGFAVLGIGGILVVLIGDHRLCLTSGAPRS